MLGTKRFWGDSIGVAVVLVGLTAVVFFSLAQWTEPTTHFRGSVRNQGPEGTQSLAGWLSELGYDIRFPSRTFAPQADDEILFVFAPDKDFSRLDLLMTQKWVLNGGTLIVVQDSRQADDLLRHFGLRLGVLFPRQREAVLSLPTLNWPWVGTMEVAARRRIRVDCGRTAVHIGDCDDPLLVSFGQGQGQIYAMSALYPFTNAGLQNEANAQFVQNLVQANATVGATILFDEVHRDMRSSWLFQTREGWGILLTALVIIVYLLAQRQRFGDARPTVPQQAPTRRQTAEFIASVANVDPARQHTSLRQHYWRRLKRQLGRRYGVDPALPDDFFLAEMKAYVDDYELSQFIALLISLREPLISDFDLQQWVRTVLEMERRD